MVFYLLHFPVQLIVIHLMLGAQIQDVIVTCFVVAFGVSVAWALLQKYIAPLRWLMVLPVIDRRAPSTREITPG